MFARQIGIDLGTVSVLVYVKGRGVVLQEPSVVAIRIKDQHIVEIGERARQMLGRTPETIEVVRPLKGGVIADYTVTRKMLEYFIGKVSALGAGLPIDTPTGNMVLDIGGGTSEAAVISVKGIVVSSSVRVGGVKIDEAIVNYIRRKYNLIIGDQTAEQLKIQIGSALPLDEPLTMEIRGRDQVAGLPKTLEVSSDEITEAISEPLEEIVRVVKNVLEKTPPELISDIIDRGIVLTGGGALLRNLDRLLTQRTGVPCYVAENAMACVAIGAGRALERSDILQYQPEL